MASSPTRKSLYTMIDQLPDSQLAAAERFLHLLELKGMKPIDDEVLSDDDLHALHEADDEIANGYVISHDEAMRQLHGRR